MRYLPKSPADRAEMLSNIGVSSIDDLFATIPAEYRLTADLDVPRQHGESEIIDHFKRAAALNAAGYTSFLGAGVYSHYKPVLIDTIVQRGEFLTSYTPYQAEITQGTLQAIFEFQTMVCELTGMEIANASMYDGSTACGEAMLMAHRVTRRKKAVISGGLHPHYSETVETVAGLSGKVVRAAATPGKPDDVIALIDDQTSCVVVQSPDVFGLIRDLRPIAAAASG